MALKLPPLEKTGVLYSMNLTCQNVNTKGLLVTCTNSLPTVITKLSIIIKCFD